MAAPNGQIIAVERLTGKTLRTYHTKYPIWNPVSLALAPNQSRIYVDTCSSSADGSTCQGGNVEVLDVVSSQNLAVISVGTDQVFGIAAAPNGKTVYAAHYPNSPDCCFSVCCAVPASTIPPSAITAFDATSFQPVGSLTVASWTPSSIAITPDSQTAYVSSGTFGNTVYQIALAQMSLVATITLPNSTVSMALSGNGATLAVSGAYGDGHVSFIDTATGAVSGPVAVGNGGLVSIGPDGKVAYVSQNFGSYVLYVVNVPALKVVAQVLTGDVLATIVSPHGGELYHLLAAGSSAEVLQQGSVTPTKLLLTAAGSDLLALSPDGQTLYSTDYMEGLWATSTTTGRVVKMMITQSRVYGMAVSPDGSTIYANLGGTSMAKVNASTGAIEKTISLPAQGQYYTVAITPAGDKLYVLGSSAGLNNTLVIDTSTLAITATIAGAGGSGLAISPSGKVVYIGTPSAIDVVETATNKITGTIPVTGAGPIVFSSDGTRAYAASAASISAVDTSSLAVIGVVTTPFLGGMGITTDGTLLYVGGAYVPGSIIDTQSLQITATFPSDGGILIH
jgi:DNA-binding beta-propeller fold protein YncE